MGSHDEGSQSPSYPEYWEADVIMRDGATAHLRPISPEDRQLLTEFHGKQSEDSIYLRFFSYKPALSEKELVRFTTVDHVDRVCFILLLDDKMIGVGRYDRTSERAAEVAFMISDHHQGRGIGSILLEHLAAAARENGIDRFTAEVLPENRKMLHVFVEAGYDVSRQFEDGVVVVDFDIDPTEKSLAVMESREHRAEARSIQDLLTPEVVAVIGASADPDHAGFHAVEGILNGGYTGTLYGVGNTPFERDGLTFVASVRDIPVKIDLAIIAVPRDAVESTVADCGRAGARAVVVMTGGYAETGAEGAVQQRRLVRIARASGMRVVGPASLGFINTSEEVSLNASLLPRMPPGGGLGLFSQSGAIGTMVYGAARRHRVGLSSYLSAGNRADVSGNDMMQYWEDDPATTVCGLYLQSVGNPRKFSRIARRLSRSKPVIVAKSEVTGLRLPPGHTGRTTQAPPGALDAMFRQAGVIRAGTAEQLLDIAAVAESQPVPENNRVAVVSNALALSQLAEDSAIRLSMEPVVCDGNVDTSQGPQRAHEAIVDAVRRSASLDGVASLVVVLMPVPGLDHNALVDEIARQARAAECTAVGVFTGQFGSDAKTAMVHTTDDGASLPCFDSPGAALLALSSVVTYSRWREQEYGHMSIPEDFDYDAIEKFLEKLKPQIPGDGLYELAREETTELLGHAGITVLESVRFSEPDQGVTAAARLGYPVALKTTDPHLRHRLDLGGVALNIEDEAQLRAAITTMNRALASFGTSDFEVQSMAAAGQTVVLRAIEDPLIGPVLSFGMAGDAVNLLEDWAHRVPPLTDQDISRMVRAPKASKKLFGHQGVPAVDTTGVEDLINRVALIKDQFPETASLDLNPVLLSGSVVTVLTATITLGDPGQRTDSARRAMRG
ncbi:GNAT family N-acetyltransferase [Kocuria sp. cx-455]|uniref:bifunctional acetate--CoA ligase family protein/GNAT family N-acetyltransferase n=1 Tax=Kocuria sp. cx-455 TaxID=2771377 RepID=UPI001685A275|nr:GNAT family N-acetyltransferase [Kocuria sp. cx-455]MBD2765546.1 GNAT family N-acetyltransferase [Kocuria sp. cx-455]